MSPAQRGLEAFRRLLGGDSDWQRGDRALTLQMLRGLAPDFFARHALQAELDDALARLDAVPAEFPPGLDLDLAMSRIDALHLRQVNGLMVQSFDREQLAAYIDAAEAAFGLLPAWLMGEQARTLKVEARRCLADHPPLAESHWLLHLYFVTHQFMLDTDYFLRPVTKERFENQLAQLERGLNPLINGKLWDLLAETELCLASCGRSSVLALEALRLAQRDDGSWAEKGHDTRQAGHTTAACLVAMAAAEGGLGA